MPYNPALNCVHTLQPSDFSGISEERNRLARTKCQGLAQGNDLIILIGDLDVVAVGRFWGRRF